MKKLLLYILFLIAISANAQQNSTSTIEEIKIEKLKPYKENVHASYYHDKFTGRKTASGIKFDNNKLTAAHKKLPFGTMLKITNKINQKSVIVKVNDRGPFINGREIDLSKKAFMDITSNKKSGGMIVTIEILEN
ncbi:septal ring lytic transglycosylase RlpA family protein [Flavobacterium psychroterrae]|uniref:Probable endolytic peptidoglycan transglycosylase RlpA n=1 Tax=Flavobacterium psychroterrae TaxID=2133767 RepID=A0ABS5PIM4_9FLAO|nr:septal ring lytic transglycosylase RlpA family protein [Flavobacterium psychroterrae]MBS7233723.1 septal ring lytic transglycosylase RlpA family protein [Flavobacterium psychroterrae]